MSRKEKLFQSIKRQPKDRSFEELVRLLRFYGFVVDESSGKGSHCPVQHKELSLRWTLSKRKPMKRYHANKVIKLVEEVKEYEQSN